MQVVMIMGPEKKEEHKSHNKFISKKLNLKNAFIVSVILLGVLLVINIILTFDLNRDLKKNNQAAQEKLKPAKIELALIKNSKCNDCFDISTVVSLIKNSKVNITKENIVEFNSKEGKDIIKKYDIQKIPALVITGEVEKVSIQGLEKKGDTLLFTQINPPYTNAMTGKIEGRVTLYYLKDSKCKKCNDMALLINQIKGAGVKIYEEKNIEAESSEGKELIKKYNIGFVPAIILSKDAGVYGIVQQAWPQIGTKEPDGTYVLRLVYPPFINLTTTKIRGLVGITYLKDKSCTECYDINLHKEILTSQQSFAIRLDNEEIYDVNDAKGKEIVAKYNITQVPTTILSDEVSAYPSSQALKQFFSVEKDGSYVFRAQVLGTYKDLETSQIVKAQSEEQ